MIEIIFFSDSWGWEQGTVRTDRENRENLESRGYRSGRCSPCGPQEFLDQEQQGVFRYSRQ
jgi:hypothetical protein